jgi:hypothetical protein
VWTEEEKVRNASGSINFSSFDLDFYYLDLLLNVLLPKDTYSTPSSQDTIYSEHIARIFNLSLIIISNNLEQLMRDDVRLQVYNPSFS